MYTPRGNLNEKFLNILEEEQAAKLLGQCRSREELLNLSRKYIGDISYEELQETLTVMESYLDEERGKSVLSDEELDLVAGGVSHAETGGKEQILYLAKRHKGMEEIIHGMFQIVQIM